MFNYFFGSDSRSLSYLKFLNDNTKNLSVVTTEPIKTGRGKNVKANIIENFCVENNIHFKYFNQNDTYEDMSNALCVSFKNIFSEEFLRMNNNIFNVHLSLLPKFKGPSPVETQILNDEVNIGYSIFKIDKKVVKFFHFFHLFIPYVFLYLNLFLCHLNKLIFYIVYVYLNNFQLS